MEVSSLEDVVKAIREDTSGQWKQALFIAPGSMHVTAGGDAGGEGAGGGGESKK